MTPFGLKSRQLRRQKGVTLKEQAEVLGVSAAYISALEHGQRGKPSPAFVDPGIPRVREAIKIGCKLVDWYRGFSSWKRVPARG